MAKPGPRIAATVVALGINTYLAKGHLEWIPDWSILAISIAAAVYWISYSDDVRAIAKSAFTKKPGTVLHPRTGQPILSPEIHVWKVIVLVVSVLLLFSFLGAVAYRVRRNKPTFYSGPAVPPQNPDPLLHFEEIPADKLTLHDLFLHDFGDEVNTDKIGGGWKLVANKTGTSLRVSYFVILKMDSNSKYLQFFVPYTQDIYNVCVDLSKFYPRALQEAGRFGIAGRGQVGDSTLNSSKQAVFTGRIFIYSEADLGSEELGKLTALYRAKSLQLQFRSNDYLENEKLKKRLKVP
ncbi:MAG: hypothetical protein ACYDDI_14415 [Candidatus Acidiferrales bacterium]